MVHDLLWQGALQCSSYCLWISFLYHRKLLILIGNAGQRFSMGRSNQNIGGVEVDLGRYELRRSGRRIKLERKPMELLIFLLERREQMVSRGDIVKKLWRSDLFIDTEKNV